MYAMDHTPLGGIYVLIVTQRQNTPFVQGITPIWSLFHGVWKLPILETLIRAADVSG